MKYSKNIELVLQILKDEVNGDVKSALTKMDKGYSMTWVYKKGEIIFPQSRPNFDLDMKEIYPLKGRKYEILNIAEGDNVVMTELIESYPDPKTGDVYRTPLIIVTEIRDGSITVGRHYCDPDISWMNLTTDQIKKAYPKTPIKFVIE